MLCPGELQRLAPLPAANEVKGETPICLSVWPSLLSVSNWTWTSAFTLRRRLENNKSTRQWHSRRLHFRPIHLFGAVVSFILAAQSPLVRHQRSDTQLGSIRASGFLAKAEAAGDAESAQQHQLSPILVDTKYWVRDMEFGERDNWRAGLKPCTLVERIAIEQEAAVISLGDSMDALGGASIESNIRELTLALDGILLMEEETVDVGATDPLFVHYLNQSGDCFDSTFFAGHEGPVSGYSSRPLFHFEPESDAMSWFNPDNWHSALADLEQISALVPESSQIPCNEDVVVFGSRQFSFWPTVQGNERSKTLTFKLNFRPAEGNGTLEVDSNMSAISSLPSIRVSKLEINQHSYSQAEFDQLTDIYGDQLFQFHDNRSVFGDKFRPDGRQDILVIDDSSIRFNNDDMIELCHEEAGCMCGNEHPDIMRIICSFREPLEPENLPCRDPIQVAGYCDKVCATNIAIVMDPDKFKETFLVSDLVRQEDDLPKGYFSDHIFVGQRRIDHNRYEVLLRPTLASDDTYEQVLGREVELAERIKTSLERSAIKSFYGIRSVSIRSSISWRRNSQPALMWIILSISTISFILMFVRNDEIFPIEPLTRISDLLRAQLVEAPFKSFPANHAEFSQGDSFLGDPMLLDQDGSVSDMPMDRIQEADLASISLDAHSVTDSTHNLIDPIKSEE